MSGRNIETTQAKSVGHQASLFEPDSPVNGPAGFRYCEDAITTEDEVRLVQAFAAMPLKEFQFGAFQGKRRVISFGWRYDYAQHLAMQAEPIPSLLLEI